MVEMRGCTPVVESLSSTHDPPRLVLNSQSVFLFSPRERDVEEGEQNSAAPMEELGVLEKHMLVGIHRVAVGVIC